MTPKKKGGEYVRDDDCPQYKSAKLCSHTLSTAVANYNFDSFIASYARVKRAPILTELATAAILVVKVQRLLLNVNPMHPSSHILN